MTYVVECLKTEWWNVETEFGTETVPVDVFDYPGILSLPDPFPAFVQRLAPYIHGSRVRFAERRTGWIARLTMPGYLDCTEWVSGETEREALQSLIDIYGPAAHDDCAPDEWQTDTLARLAELSGD